MAKRQGPCYKKRQTEAYYSDALYLVDCTNCKGWKVGRSLNVRRPQEFGRIVRFHEGYGFLEDEVRARIYAACNRRQSCVGESFYFHELSIELFDNIVDESIRALKGSCHKWSLRKEQLSQCDASPMTAFRRLENAEVDTSPTFISLLAKPGGLRLLAFLGALELISAQRCCSMLGKCNTACGESLCEETARSACKSQGWHRMLISPTGLDRDAHTCGWKWDTWVREYYIMTMSGKDLRRAAQHSERCCCFARETIEGDDHIDAQLLGTEQGMLQAIDAHNCEYLRATINAGSNPSAAMDMSENETPLMYIALNRFDQPANLEATRLLLDMRADPNVCYYDNDTTTVLHMAIRGMIEDEYLQWAWRDPCATPLEDAVLVQALLCGRADPQSSCPRFYNQNGPSGPTVSAMTLALNRTPKYMQSCCCAPASLEPKEKWYMVAALYSAGAVAGDDVCRVGQSFWDILAQQNQS